MLVGEVRELKNAVFSAEGSESVLFVIDDALEDALSRKMGELNSYRLENESQTFSSQGTGFVQLSPEESRRGHFVNHVDWVNGHEQRVLMLAPQRQSPDESLYRDAR